MEFDDYDVDDIYFDEEDAERSRSAQDKKSKNKRNQEDAGLGIDEEISVAKRQRAPRVKLDEVRLLSEKGIPELRRRASKLKFKGKGHEVCLKREYRTNIKKYQTLLQSLSS